MDHVGRVVDPAAAEPPTSFSVALDPAIKLWAWLAQVTRLLWFYWDSGSEFVLGDFHHTSFAVSSQLQLFRYVCRTTAMLPILD